jgi:hypothetical protein
MPKKPIQVEAPSTPLSLRWREGSYYARQGQTDREQPTWELWSGLLRIVVTQMTSSPGVDWRASVYIPHPMREHAKLAAINLEDAKLEGIQLALKIVDEVADAAWPLRGMVPPHA